MSIMPDPDEIYDQYAAEPLTEPIEQVPDDMPEDLDELSQVVTAFELGRKIGEIHSDETWWRGVGDGIAAALKPCRRWHRHERPRRRGLRPPTYGALVVRR